MSEVIETTSEPASTGSKKPSDLISTEPIRFPQFQRDVFPKNNVLSADELREFCELLMEANERAKIIEYDNFDLTTFDSEEEAQKRVNEMVPLEYNYTATNGNSVKGHGIPKTNGQSFPEDLKTFFISNASYAQNAINVRPLNTVEVFLAFEKPSLKMDFETLPSNPTENKSVINVSGRDEDWVISTAERIQSFFKNRQTFRPIIHSSGTYDYILYLAFLPTLIWLFHKKGMAATEWLESQTMFMNIVLGTYVFLLSLLVARFFFQYFRWLFPPMEYYKRHRWGAYVHRSVAGAIGAAIILGGIYDLVKTAFNSLFGG